MSQNIETMINDIIRREGGFVDHPDDRGGPTNFGITQKTLSRHLGRQATTEDVRRLPRELAAEIYRRAYYQEPGLDEAPGGIRAFLFDSAVNHGPRRAVRFLQQVCNAAGFGGLAADGVFGPMTRRQAAVAEREMGPWLLAALTEERRMFYQRIVARDPSQRVFLKGWMNRLAEFDHMIGELAP